LSKKRLLSALLAAAIFTLAIPVYASDIDTTVKDSSEVLTINENYDNGLIPVAASIESNVYTIDSSEQTLGELQEALSSLDEDFGLKGTAAITEVYSINNDLDGCYYKPLLSELPYLEEYVLKDGSFANAYTGFFDLTNSVPYKGNAESRELEILGYDFLLTNESYNGKTYSASRISGGISKQTAVMNVYKAMGKDIYEIKCFYSKVDKEKLISSPAIKDLSWIVNDLNTDRGKTQVFVTRTNPLRYATKAKSDLHFSESSVSDKETITLGEFIVLVAAMMDFYGEPVMSNGEMNALLQVFGADIPAYLSRAQREAYVYLKARGILVDNSYNYTGSLTFEQMIDILMRVKDKGSRMDLKEIQVVTTLDDQIQMDGCFPKTVAFASGDEAIEVERSYYYEDIVQYDYYLDKRNTGFSDSSSIYVPLDINNYKESESVIGYSYMGIEVIDGVEHWHFKLTVVSDGSNYFSDVKARTGVDNAFVVAEANSNNFIVVQQGGGIYSVSNVSTSVRPTTRRSFAENELKGSVDKERREASMQAQRNTETVFDKVREFFNPKGVLAAETNTDLRAAYNTTMSNVKVKLVLYNVSNIDIGSSKDVSEWAGSQKEIYQLGQWDRAADTLTIMIYEDKIDYFLASIKRTAENTAANPGVTCISNVEGNVWVKLSDLINMGLVYENGVTDLSDNVLALDTVNGRIVLNNEYKQVIAGTTFYQLANTGTALYYSDMRDIFVDFRAVYGWSANIAETSVNTSDGLGYTVNTTKIDESKVYHHIIKQCIELNKYFSDSNNEYCLIVDPKIVTDNYMLMATSNYALSNWIIYEGLDNNDYVYVFYHKDMFENMGLSSEVPNDMDTMRIELAPYNGIIDDWVIRRYALTKTANNTPGEFTYAEGYGYLYNLPKAEDFNIQEYLSGTGCKLPITVDTSTRYLHFYNNNVNIFSGFKYATRPLTGTFSTGQEVETVNIDGEIEISKYTGSTITMEAAPAGVQAFFGGLQLTTINSDVNDITVKLENQNDGVQVYFGTSKMKLFDNTNKNTKNRVFFIYVPAVDKYPSYVIKQYFDAGNKLYEVAKWMVEPDTKAFCYRYLSFKALTVENTIPSEEVVEEREAITVYDTESKDLFAGFESFRLEYLLDMIDETTSIVFFVCLTIIPFILVIFLTIIIGLSLMRDVKIVRIFFERAFDPVKILTFGKLTFEKLDRKKAVITLLLGYMLFALICGGNIIVIIAWLSQGFHTIVDVLRNN